MLITPSNALFKRRRTSLGVNFDNGSAGTLVIPPQAARSGTYFGTGQSICLWVKPLAAATGTCDIFGVADVEAGPTLASAMLVTMTATAIGVSNQTTNTTITTYTVGHWYFLACLFTSTTLKVYVLDWTNQAWANASVSTPAPTTPFDGWQTSNISIGNAYHNSAPFGLSGWKVFSKTLTSTEILAESRQLAPASTQLLSYAPFEIYPGLLTVQEAPFYRKNTSNFGGDFAMRDDVPPVPEVAVPARRRQFVTVGSPTNNAIFFGMT